MANWPALKFLRGENMGIQKQETISITMSNNDSETELQEVATELKNLISERVIQNIIIEQSEDGDYFEMKFILE